MSRVDGARGGGLFRRAVTIRQRAHDDIRQLLHLLCERRGGWGVSVCAQARSRL